MAPDLALPDEARGAIENIGEADIVVGVPSFNNARTIPHVIRAIQAGLARYFSRFSAVIINSDGGSCDGTPEAALAATFDLSRLLILSTPLAAVHRLSFPYHGVPGKGSAFRLVFQMTRALRAKACVVVDADLRSITPEWIDSLLRPVLHADHDFVAPWYHRHKYDGTITNSIVYPLTRSLYGKRIRQPIGGDFGLSPRLVERYLTRSDWETDVARFGIDIWMTTVAVAENFRTCQSFLGAKLHDARDPAADLSEMLRQVTGSVFGLMEEYQSVWGPVSGSAPVDLYGFPHDVGLDPIAVNVDRMIEAFRAGCEHLDEIWSLALQADVLKAVHDLASRHLVLDDELWMRIIFDFACAWRRHRLERAHLLRSLTPLYLARTASFVMETREMFAAEVEQRIEALCITTEEMKPYLLARWRGGDAAIRFPPRAAAHAQTSDRMEVLP
ncbi:MAG TPA: cell wall biosynthesis glycosyltransferase [Bryobacteraceae bacterium]|nr:cell wall biosynthesis glycosyltransferase [Bryobacteraceae bacterium]